MLNGTYTTIVIGPDNREFDLGAGDRFPKTETYIPKNAFVRKVEQNGDHAS